MRLSHSGYQRGGEPAVMDRPDADGLLAASSVTVLEAKSKNVPDAVSSPRSRRTMAVGSRCGLEIPRGVHYSDTRKGTRCPRASLNEKCSTTTVSRRPRLDGRGAGGLARRLPIISGIVVSLVVAWSIVGVAEETQGELPSGLTLSLAGSWKLADKM